MSNYPCKLIEGLIPLYIDGDISEDNKKIVEMHLKECKNCSTLVQEYSNYDIKLDAFKDDLPQANNFIKWIKKNKNMEFDYYCWSDICCPSNRSNSI